MMAKDGYKWLVGGFSPYPSEKWWTEFVSWDDFPFPIFPIFSGKVMGNSMVPVTTNQVIFLWDDPNLPQLFGSETAIGWCEGWTIKVTKQQETFQFIELTTELWLFQELKGFFPIFPSIFLSCTTKWFQKNKGVGLFTLANGKTKVTLWTLFHAKVNVCAVHPPVILRTRLASENGNGPEMNTQKSCWKELGEFPRWKFTKPKCPVLSYRMCLLMNIKIICRLLLFAVRFKHARSSHLACGSPLGSGFQRVPVSLRLDEFRMPWGRDVPKSQSYSWMMTGASPIGNLHFLHHITSYWLASMLRMDTNGPLA